jgi:hypothetical protein
VLSALVLLRAVRGAFSGRRRAELIALALASFSGVAGWTAYNAFLYGNPLQFADAEFYSAAFQTRDGAAPGSVLNVLGVYIGTAIVVYGPTLLAALACVFVRPRSPTCGYCAVLAFLAVPPLATVVSLLGRIGEMTFWFNARYTIVLSPLLIVLAVVSAERLRGETASRRRALVGSVALCFVFSALMVVVDAVPSYLDARTGFTYGDTPSAVQAAVALRSAYDGGRIVVATGAASEHRIMVTAGIPLAEYDEILDSSTWKGQYTEPWRYGRWLVLSSVPGSDASAVVASWNGRRSEFDAHYGVAYENDDYKVLIRKEPDSTS